MEGDNLGLYGFLSKTYDMVDDCMTANIVSWKPGCDTTFIIWSPMELARELLPAYFHHTNFSRFLHQLKSYGFKKVDPEQWEFWNEGFVRSQKHLLKNIVRRKLRQERRCLLVEECRSGIRQEILNFKKKKNILMQRCLNKHSLQLEKKVNVLNDRIQGLRHWQKKVTAFLAKVGENEGRGKRRRSRKWKKNKMEFGICKNFSNKFSSQLMEMENENFLVPGNTKRQLRTNEQIHAPPQPPPAPQPPPLHGQPKTVSDQGLYLNGNYSFWYDF